MPHRTGTYRAIETVMSVVLLIVAVRTAVPVGPSQIYLNEWLRVLSAAIIAAPAVWLLFAKSAKARPRALLFTVFTYFYLSALGLINDWTRFPSVALAVGFSAIGVILYVGARAEERRQ
jgi:hypothetical protein